MILKAAWRNITSKPLRAVATVLAIAVAVAMIFCMFSFKSAVFDFIYASETADAGNSDIIVTFNSDGPKFTDVNALKNVSGIKEAVPVLSLFARFNGEYIRLRGFENKDKLVSMQDIEISSGDVSSLGAKPDNIVISEKAAKHFGISLGDGVEISLGAKKTTFYVTAIAKNSGYFLSDSPFVFIGNCVQGVARLMPLGASLYNEIYVKVAENQKINEIIAEISALPAYANMKVEISKDSTYIEEKTVSLTAPIVVAGAAIVVLGLACIALLFLMSEKDKIAYMAKLTVVGATKKQILSIFLLESVILTAIGALAGIALASGIFILLLKLTLSSTVSFTVSAPYLLGAAALGIAVSLIASLTPLLRASGSSVRENETGIKQKSKLPWFIVPLILVAVTAVTVAVEFAVPSTKGAMSIVNIALAFITSAAVVAAIIKVCANLGAKTENNPVVKVASVSIKRENRFSRSLAALTVGMLASMALFTAWSLTTSVFDAFTSDFKNMALITNVDSNLNAADIEMIDGVESATPMVWTTADVTFAGGKSKTLNIFGSAKAIDLLDFKYHTPRESVIYNLNSSEKQIILDYAMSVLFGVKEGETVSLELNGIKETFTVGGIVEHKLFGGNYAIISGDVLLSVYGAKADTVLTVVSGDVKTAIGLISEKYADKNYYAVEALEAYKWEQQSLDSVFDLIGVLAVIITLFVFAVTVATVTVGRSGAVNERQTLLAAGISKNDLLKTEIYQHGVTALIALVISSVVSVLLAACLINAMRLFGLYFGFMFEPWVIIAVGVVLGAAYTLLPLVLNYKKRYNLKRN